MSTPGRSGLSGRPSWIRHPPGWLTASARAAVVLVVLAAVAKVGADNFRSLRHVRLRANVGWLVAAAAGSLSAGLFMPLGWRLLVRAYGSRVPVRASLSLWWTAQITRYVPTGTVALATRVVLAARQGVPRMLAAASLPIEVAVIVAWGSILAGGLLPDYLLAPWARILITTAAVGGLALLPVLLGSAGRYIPRPPRPSPWSQAAPAIYGAEAWYALNSLVRTAAFVLLARGLLPVRWGDVSLLAGAFNGGAVAGLVSIAPGGLGVREGILTLALRQRFGFGDAAALAVALRLWDLGTDAVWLVTARLAGGRTRYRGEGLEPALPGSATASDVIEVAPGQGPLPPA